MTVAERGGFSEPLALSHAPRHANARGALFALTAFAVYSTHDVVVKFLGSSYSPIQIVFFANLFGFPIVTLMLMRDRVDGNLRPRHPWWTLIRTVAAVTSTLCVFYAFSVLPLAQTYALIFAAPLLITILAVPILGETVGWHRTARGRRRPRRRARGAAPRRDRPHRRPHRRARRRGLLGGRRGHRPQDRPRGAQRRAAALPDGRELRPDGLRAPLRLPAAADPRPRRPRPDGAPRPRRRPAPHRRLPRRQRCRRRADAVFPESSGRCSTASSSSARRRTGAPGSAPASSSSAASTSSSARTAPPSPPSARSCAASPAT